MWVKIPEPNPTKDNPFDGDSMGRQPYIKLLTTHLTYGDPPQVISLNGDWGSGKTVFVKMWKEYLASQGFVALYFNAWDYDFSDDPLAPFLFEMHKQIGEAVPLLAQTQLDIFLEISKNILKSTPSNLIKKMTLDAVDLEKAYQSCIDQQLLCFKDHEKKIEDFKGMLNKLAETIQTQVRKGNESQATTNQLSQDEEPLGKNYPVFVFVDELDRCKPTFAIRLLERIKHLFTVDGFVFVLSVARKQLEQSIKAVYGSDFDADWYLRRFFDYEYSLPREEGRLLQAWVKDAFSKLPHRAMFHRDLHNGLASNFMVLSKIFNADARTQRQILRQFFFLLTPFDELFGVPNMFLFMLFLQRFDPALLDLLRKENNNGDASLAMEYIEKNNPALWSYLTDSWEGDRYGPLLHAFIACNTDIMTKSGTYIAKLHALKEDDEKSSMATTVLSIVEDLQFKYNIRGDVDFFFKRIEMGDNLTPKDLRGNTI